MRLAANLSIVYQRLPFLERFEAASRSGFDVVEFWWPRAEIEAGLTQDQIVDAVDRARLAVALINFDGGYLPDGDRGIAGDPTRAPEFRASVPVALELARRLDCPRLNALAGKQLAGVSADEHRDLLLDSITFAADAAAAAGRTVLVEPLNAAETPGYLLPTADAALELISAIGRPNVRLQFDVYHIARAGDDPLEVIRRAGDLIGHMQIADVPGRHEPGTGDLQLAGILEELARAGYAGDVGLEYVPTDPESPDFAYLPAMREALAAAAAIRL